MNTYNQNGWHFVGTTGTFTLQHPQATSYLYFPLCNEAGMLSSITPLLHGDIKTGQHTFATPPVSIGDLLHHRSARNFWVFVEGRGAWSVAGTSAPQIARHFQSVAPERHSNNETIDRVMLEAGLLWHRVRRENQALGLRADVTNFVPTSDDLVELMRVDLTNIGSRDLSLTPTAAMTLYGRSASTVREYRHMSSLFHQIHTHPFGVLVRPTLLFDTQGYQVNQVTYGVLGTEADGMPPVGFFPTLEGFVGEGGCLEWPAMAVLPPDTTSAHLTMAGEVLEGQEAMGALRFQKAHIPPGKTISYIVLITLFRKSGDANRLVKIYGSTNHFDTWLLRNQAHWQTRLDTVSFPTFTQEQATWTKWVQVQPLLRQYYGTSFLPYHDYGHGGRGWCEVWQDSLALLLTDPDYGADRLAAYYAGIRMDGSNATLVGNKPGEFWTDTRERSPVRVDHGAWPFLATRLYIDQSGDLAFLLREQPYRKDGFCRRAARVDPAWQESRGSSVRDARGTVYLGTLLEHLLVQHLTAFFDVGPHHHIRLASPDGSDGSDGSDGLERDAEPGESVNCTALYASNLLQLSRLVLHLDKSGTTEVDLASELMPLLDTRGDPVSYDSASDKQQRLAHYLTLTETTLSGSKTRVSLQELAQDLMSKARWLYRHIREHEWVLSRDGFGWFNGSYDSQGQQVEGDFPNGVRITLAGQVFPLMGSIATSAQARQIVRSVNHYLLDQQVGGHRLHSDFPAARSPPGRCSGFGFGHQEHGAMSSHLEMMYAYALYQRGFVREGYEVLERVYQHCQNFAVSRVYPGLPDYFDHKGRGRYPYLTGAASWLLLTLVTGVFGVRGTIGNLSLAPRLVREQFAPDGQATLATRFAGRKLTIRYQNPGRLDYGMYRVKAIAVNGQTVAFERREDAVVIERTVIADLNAYQTHQLEVSLGSL